MTTEDHPLSFECRRRLYLNIADCLDKWFDRVYRKYIRVRQPLPGCEEPTYTLHFGNEEPWYVIHRLKLLLTHMMKDFNEVYNFDQDELLYYFVRNHKCRLKAREQRRRNNLL